MSLAMHEVFEIIIPDEIYNYKEGVQQTAYQCHDQIWLIQPHM
jgi:hypothetical protein